jgi:hypothetical protein
MRTTLLSSLIVFLPLLFQDSTPRQTPTLPVVGRPAPAFRLNDHTGKGVAIGGEAKAWTVLAFYPKAATPG